MDALTYLVPLFFLTALVYSMAGLGGGSTYIALLALLAFPYESIPKIGLLCNLTVVLGGSWIFYKAGHFAPRRILPFVVTSVPAAYWGGTIPIGKEIFTVLLAVSLIVASLRLFFTDKAFESRISPSWKTAWLVGVPVGAALGLLSGLVGIGGGIYLAPLLLLLGWADSKQAAAAASFFILVNSLAGLLGQFYKVGSAPGLELVAPLVIAVFLGGQIGSRLGARTLPKIAVQRASAVLILWVSLRLLSEVALK